MEQTAQSISVPISLQTSRSPLIKFLQLSCYFQDAKNQKDSYDQILYQTKRTIIKVFQILNIRPTEQEMTLCIKCGPDLVRKDPDLVIN